MGRPLFGENAYKITVSKVKVVWLEISASRSKEGLKGASGVERFVHIWDCKCGIGKTLRLFATEARVILAENEVTGKF